MIRIYMLVKLSHHSYNYKPIICIWYMGLDNSKPWQVREPQILLFRCNGDSRALFIIYTNVQIWTNSRIVIKLFIKRSEKNLIRFSRNWQPITMSWHNIYISILEEFQLFTSWISILLIFKVPYKNPVSVCMLRINYKISHENWH